MLQYYLVATFNEFFFSNTTIDREYNYWSGIRYLMIPGVRLFQMALSYIFFLFYSGEVKLLVDPEAHQEQFARFLQKCGDICDTEKWANGHVHNIHTHNILMAGSRGRDNSEIKSNRGLI